MAREPRFVGRGDSKAGKPGQQGARKAQDGVKKKQSSLKNRIRSVERLLRKESLDQRVRKHEEQQLQALRRQLEEHERGERERLYAVRYHKIRFFERVKLERRIKQLQRQLVDGEQGGAEPDQADVQRLAQLQDDLQYVLHFPRGEKYVSVLKEAADPEAAAALATERVRLRALVHAQLADTALLAEADEGAAVRARHAAAAVQPAAAAAAAAEEGHAAAACGMDSMPAARALGEGVGAGSTARRQEAARGPGKPADSSEAHPKGGGAGSKVTAVKGAAGQGAVGAARRAGLDGSSRAAAGAAAAAAAPQQALPGKDDIADDDFFLQSSDNEASSSGGDEPAAATQLPPAAEERGAAAAHRRASIEAGLAPAAVGGMDRHAGVGPARQKVGQGARHGRPKPRWLGGPAKEQRGGQQAIGPVSQKRKAPAALALPQNQPSLPAGKQPLRTRAEGGRKRRKKGA